MWYPPTIEFYVLLTNQSNHFQFRFNFSHYCQVSLLKGFYSCFTHASGAEIIISDVIVILAINLCKPYLHVYLTHGSLVFNNLVWKWEREGSNPKLLVTVVVGQSSAVDKSLCNPIQRNFCLHRGLISLIWAKRKSIFQIKARFIELDFKKWAEAKIQQSTPNWLATLSDSDSLSLHFESKHPRLCNHYWNTVSLYSVYVPTNQSKG